jgi:hypothetical protein
MAGPQASLLDSNPVAVLTLGAEEKRRVDADRRAEHPTLFGPGLPLITPLSHEQAAVRDSERARAARP